MEITDAEGNTSHEDDTANSGISSNATAIKPVLLSNVELADANTDTLGDANQVIGKLTVTADTWSNQKQADADAAELGLKTVVLGCTLTNVTGNLKLETNNGSVSASCTGGKVEFDLTSLSDADRILNSGESKTFDVSLDGATINSDATVSLSLNENSNGKIVYSEFDDSCTSAGANSCVEEMRLGVVNFGSASATNN